MEQMEQNWKARSTRTKKRTEHTPGDFTALLRSADVLIHVLLSSVLSGAVVLGQYAPFGVAMAGASGSGLCGAAALSGACFGYMTLLGFSDCLRYAAAAILTFAVGFAFYDIKLLRGPWAMPLVAGAMNACTGFVYLSQQGWRTVDVIYFLTEIVLTIGGAWGFRMVLTPIRTGRGDRLLAPERRVGLLILLCALLASLSSLYLYKEISLGRILAAACLGAAGWLGGPGTGALAGVSIGLALDLAAMGTPVYAMSYGLAGLAAGCCRGRGRIPAALACGGAMLGAALWTWDNGLPLSLLFEACAGCALFLALPQKRLKRLTLLLAPRGQSVTDLGAPFRVGRRLRDAAGAFRTLYDSLQGAFQAPKNDNDIAMVFDRAASRICKKCSLQAGCWDRDYVTTFNALNDATAPMLDRGRGEPADFPQYFSDRCLHFPAFLSAVNEELTALRYRQQYNSRIQESRAAVCRQYAEMSSLLERAAVELGEELAPEPMLERRLRQHLAGLGVEAGCGAFRDGRGRLRVEISGKNSQVLEQTEEVDKLSQALGVLLRPDETEPGRVSLVQLEPLVAVAGVAARKKSGETVSGDAGTCFKRQDGTLCVLLCDGMGSGPEANRESTLAVRLLEQFLQAGVETEHALLTLNAALALRGETGFTTVDLLQVDLFNGESVLYKFGAAPTYIRKGSQVRRLTGTSLPAGLDSGEQVRPDKTLLKLEPGDCVLMVSDGIVGTQDDQWLRDRLLQFDGQSPKELAASLITQTPEGATDDRTALAVKIGKR